MSFFVTEVVTKPALLPIDGDRHTTLPPPWSMNARG